MWRWRLSLWASNLFTNAGESFWAPVKPRSIVQYSCYSLLLLETFEYAGHSRRLIRHVHLCVCALVRLGIRRHKIRSWVEPSPSSSWTWVWLLWFVTLSHRMLPSRFFWDSQHQDSSETEASVSSLLPIAPLSRWRTSGQPYLPSLLPSSLPFVLFTLLWLAFPVLWWGSPAGWLLPQGSGLSLEAES